MPQTDPRPTRDRAEDRKPGAERKTPSPDLQPADAGTAASGNAGTPTAPVMKQSAKTDAERGAR